MNTQRYCNSVFLIIFLIVISLPNLLSIQDHYFDVVTNAVGLVAAVLGDKFYWWIDPAGAIVLAIYTIINWSGTVLENAGRFSGFLFFQNKYFSSVICCSTSFSFDVKVLLS